MDHPIAGLFDTDLFIEDLRSGTKRFCSSLLVVSILAWACVNEAALHQHHGSIDAFGSMDIHISPSEHEKFSPRCMPRRFDCGTRIAI
jgi:hypothetical protein